MLAALNVYSSEGIAYGYFHTTVLHKFFIYHLELDGSLGYIFNNQHPIPGHLAPILGSKLHSRLVGSKLYPLVLVARGGMSIEYLAPS